MKLATMSYDANKTRMSVERTPTPTASTTRIIAYLISNSRRSYRCKICAPINVDRKTTPNFLQKMKIK